ncbi:hypothetical protein VM77_00170 [Citromicrobium sp. JL31]|uniref:hypothetical protein n=2 Tax=Sphingomonadaceae TaxID=41297 RepID=UPI0001DD0BC0|nr:hypothetical protein [Citromicrobium sp. JL477]ALG61432.1 hypothetical protein WG74_11765 [Citromicrobium sp. JL477]KPM14383.1 hypothetical protein VO58_11285 [Citromicrobium sp. JL1351]KPM20864.1 hypothetical protein VM77_00170 [Citromicrobium sp. JL31]KPM26849.1 hypothetical protein VO57_06185 [Citromicrobium sp. JL2201]
MGLVRPRFYAAGLLGGILLMTTGCSAATIPGDTRFYCTVEGAKLFEQRMTRDQVCARLKDRLDAALGRQTVMAEGSAPAAGGGNWVQASASFFPNGISRLNIVLSQDGDRTELPEIEYMLMDRPADGYLIDQLADQGANAISANR